MSRHNKDTVWVGPELCDGRRPFVRRKDTGEPEVGLLGSDPLDGADSVIELDHVQGDEYEVRSEIRFTAMGPTQVASSAYRAGWSRVFGGRAPVGNS